MDATPGFLHPRRGARLPARPGPPPLCAPRSAVFLDLDGLLLEDKGTTLALHYRLAPRLASHVHRIVRAHVAEAGDALAQPPLGATGQS